MNTDLRLQVVEMIRAAGEGHIPSAFSILDIIHHLYENVLVYHADDPQWRGRDYFILSKGHGSAALYVVLHKFGFITPDAIANYSQQGGILGGHPDATKVPGVEASTGSLGHGFPLAVGTALGLRIKHQSNRVFTLLGDGECHEGTVWESAHVAANRQLGNLCAIVDWNGSAAQLMPHDDLPAKWRAFGWNVIEINGHEEAALKNCFAGLQLRHGNAPTAVIAHTVKGKGVPFIEGHGPWHHRIPNDDDFLAICEALDKGKHCQEGA